MNEPIDSSNETARTGFRARIKNGEKGSGNVRRGLDNVRECFSKKSEIWGLHNVRAEYEKPALNPPFRAFW